MYRIAFESTCEYPNRLNNKVEFQKRKRGINTCLFRNLGLPQPSK